VGAKVRTLTQLRGGVADSHDLNTRMLVVIRVLMGVILARRGAWWGTSKRRAFQ